MAYLPDAIAAGYLRESDAEFPVPGHGFAQRVQALIAAPATRPKVYEPATRPGTRDAAEAAPWAVGEVAKW
ncbi:hypothetical protein [Streptomyces sp. AC602_WCS936]|uniref:hypothetical protein n=1 Tax=Streptomyces sp. AC602_WCS936 TaxID=2823685 RepID=UPI001C2768FB|nr:hypothetical protein [Streptomyces sp. AC602_WCS936]